MKRVLADMSGTLIHHGHVRLLKKASEIGDVIVGLTSDEQIKMVKGYQPELSFDYRKEIFLAIRYVSEVIEADWMITQEFLDRYKIDYLIHGSDNSNQVETDRLIILDRTPDISSSIIRKLAAENLTMIESQKSS